MITLTRDEAEIVHEFLCELRVQWQSIAKPAAWDELSDCIGWMENRMEGAAAGTAPPRDGAPVPVAPAIKTGDIVRHRPSGETWTVYEIRGDKVYVCCGLRVTGIPVDVSDCELVKRKEERENANTT